MNLHRNPLCGRNFEYYSEDPVVTGKIAAAYVRGVQAEGAGTSIKHFAVNSQETRRTSVDERVSQRAARELYLRGFEIAVRESEPWTVMASYNIINGTYAQGNHDLLTKILRDDWGYKGIVMTDWIGIRDGLRTIDEVHAGNDLMEPGQPQQAQEIVDGVKNGQLDIADVDRNVRRMLEYIVKTPSFRKYKATNTPDLKGHAGITRRVANEGIVLLKNDHGTLPLAKSIKTPKAAATHTSDYLTPVQAANLLKTIKDTHTKAAARDYVMCNLVLALGMRTIEIERANVGHLHQKNGMWFLEIHGKGGKNVAKKIDDGVAAMLLEYLQGRGAVPEDAPLFAATSNHQGTEGRIPAKSISRIIKGHLVHAGINSSRITAHSLRHTAAMFKLKACNGNLKETQEFMRHSDPKTTMIYLDAINAEKDTSSADVMAMIHAAM